MNVFLKKRFVLLRNSSFSNRKQKTFCFVSNKNFPQFRKCFVLLRKKLFKRSKSDLFCFVWDKMFKLSFKEVVDRKFLWEDWVHHSNKFASYTSRSTERTWRRKAFWKKLIKPDFLCAKSLRQNFVAKLPTYTLKIFILFCKHCLISQN